MWGLAVKVFSNVLVILLNYVFSKLIIFKKKQ
jgi:putative flippase GtrA